MTAKMTRYTNDFGGDDDSINSVRLNEGISSSATHIRYHPGAKIWELRSTLEKILLSLCTFLFLVVLILSVIVNVVDHHLQDVQRELSGERAKAPCSEEACVHAASELLAAMGPRVDPCDDFYEFACGSWNRAHPAPDARPTWGTFNLLEMRNQLVIKNGLEKPTKSLKSKAEKKAKMYYESCMDANDTVESLGAKPMLKLLGNIGGWNVSTANFSVAEWTLQHALELVQNSYQVSAFFSYLVGEDDKNSSRYVLQVDQSGLALPTRDNYLNRTEHAKILKAYEEYMTKVGVLLGGEPNSTRDQMKAVLEFETRLANITVPDELRRDEEKNYHAMTIMELQERADFIDWQQFFNNALRLAQKKITNKEKIVVYAPDYLGNLTQLVKEYENSTEGKIILNNYLTWQAVRTYSGYLSKAFRDAYKGLRVALMGNDGGEEAQWRYCVQDTNNVLGFAVGAIFIREVFRPESKLQVERMIANVKEAFKRNFDRLEWMDPETRRLAVEKADAITDMIGYPDFVKDSKQLDEKFKELEVRNDTYFENNLQINKFNARKNLEKIDERVNKTTWSMSPSAVNAYYTPTKNQMVFPAGILQAPFFDAARPASLNYGGVGVVMGHELTHGFDDQGRLFDKDGNLTHWWNNATVDRFKERARCVVDQYGRYEINGKHVNGNTTLGENIADNGGLKAAYHAYLELMRDLPEPKKLPGLDLNHRQLFFVGFAQVWCSSATKEVASLQLEKDSHTPAKYRVIGALSNLREFSDEFGCKAGSKMNPEHKCELW